MAVDGVTDDRFGEFCGWLTKCQPDLRRLAGRLTSSATDAADLAQATSLRALEKRTLFVSGSFNELKKWLTRIMFNLHYERLRGGVREVLADWLDEVPAANEPPSPLWLTVADEEVDAAVAQLNPTLRVVYVLYTVDGCSYANISSRLQIPLQTVATKIHRARARLRQTLTAGRQGPAPGGTPPGGTPTGLPAAGAPATPDQPAPYGASRSCKRPVIICSESTVQDSW
jgi:RNA polymerase sigma factor (sigma-70 family)